MIDCAAVCIGRCKIRGHLSSFDKITFPIKEVLCFAPVQSNGLGKYPHGEITT